MHGLDTFPRSGKVSYPMLDAKKISTTMISTLNPEKLMVEFYGIIYDDDGSNSYHTRTRKPSLCT